MLTVHSSDSFASILPPVPLDHLDVEGVRLEASFLGPPPSADAPTVVFLHEGLGTAPQVEGVALLAPHVLVEPATLSGVNGAIDAFEKGRLRDHLSRYHDHVDDAFWGWATAWTEFGRQGWDVRPLLPGIRVPVLVLQGDDDEYGSAAQYESIRTGVSGPVEVRVLDRCRHLLYRDAPFQVVDSLTAFVGAVSRR